MQNEAFEKWLKPEEEKIIKDAISRLERIEKLEGDLDRHFENDGGRKLLKKLSEPDTENYFKNRGDKKRAMDALKTAFENYCKFRKDSKRNEPTANIDSFEEFLIKKNKEDVKIDWDKRREKWLHSIDNLYTEIKVWMAPFQKEGLLKISDEREINIIEEHIGRYQAKRLDLYLGNDIISLIPKGTRIYGYCGRIDMSGPKGEYMILEPKWGKWKITGRTSRSEPWDFTKESFKHIIKEIAD